MNMPFGLGMQDNLSIGLLKRNQKNDVETYAKMARIMSSTGEGAINSEFWSYIGEQIKQSPEEYFNFGFTYNDFKQFLLKLMYMRAERKFFESRFVEKIQTKNPYDQYGHEN